MKKKYCISFIFLIGLIALILDKNTLINMLPFIYLSIFVLLNCILYSSKDTVRTYFSPSAVMTLYVSFFFFMGTLAFKFGLVQLDIGSQLNYYSFNDMNILTFYFVTSICITLVAHIISSTKVKDPKADYKVVMPSPPGLSPAEKILVFTSVIIMLAAMLFEIPLPGGVGSFSSVFFMYAAIHLTYICKMHSYKLRVLIYIFVAFLFAVFFFQDRRCMAFYMFISLFIEVHQNKSYRLGLKKIFVCVTFLIVFFMAIIAMSIHRGVGQYGSQSVVDAFGYINEYLKSDWAYTMTFHNFEGPATTFHSYNGLNYILQYREYKYGATFLKFLCLPLPRSEFPIKPRSMVDEYTSIFYPVFRLYGGSFVPNFYVEAAWNFGLVGGWLFLFIAFIIFDRIYFKWLTVLRNGKGVKNIFYLSSFSFLPFLFRGSGLDLFLLFSLIFYIMCLFYNFISTILLSSSRLITR